ncbi:putative sodium-coupled neutral amino acid transporter 11 [Lingula anatina]|uniref:Putative sodium-coupled neutral amino acid transporter 11 n=1 Tax=Lingula anatina TaxID=7574 RepID=A0A2R2MPC7_LINAN|nr:putative sodium-coupled neutral amino acid transporter 11 [Lingula anatina]|eukprot:XP_023932089.1 putative sodium-coupled neutral amino acid transporter 11 [Lingula anatina]
MNDPGHVEIGLNENDVNKVVYYGSQEQSPQSSPAHSVASSDDDQRPLVSGGQSPLESGPSQEEPTLLSESNEEVKPVEKLSSVPAAVLNVINSIIGSGIVGMPFALKEGGIGMAVLLIIVVGVLTDYSLQLLIAAGLQSKTSTYQDVMQVAFGRPGFYLISLLQFANPFLAMTSYNIIAGDTIEKIVYRTASESVKNSVLGNRQFILFLFTIFISMPLSCYRNIAKLSKFSACAILSISFVTVFIMVRAVTMAREVPKTDDAWIFAEDGIVQAMGIITTAYLCHHNSFLIFRSLKEPTQQCWNKVVHISVGSSMVASLVFGLFGYITFTGYTQGDLLENYCYSDDYANVTRLIFTFSVMLTYPIECFVTREVIENLLFGAKQPATLLRHMLVTLALVLATGGISMVTNCLGIVLELNGALAAIPMCFILPCLSYMKISHDNGDKILQIKNIFPTIVAITGIAFSVVGLVLVLKSIVDGSAFRCSDAEEMGYCYDINQVRNSSYVSAEASLIETWSNSTN